jgi:hypothetical protein
MKHIKLFEEYIAINEIGEGTTPFKWRRTGEKVVSWATTMSSTDRSDGKHEYDLPTLSYEFSSDNATYIVKVGGNFAKQTYIPAFMKPGAKKPADFHVSFGVSFDVVGSEKEQITNFGEQFRVISTVADIVINEVMKELQEYEWFKVKEIYLMPKLEDEEEGKPIAQTKRGRLYLEYIKKQGRRLEGNWTAFINKDMFVIKDGKWSGTDKMIQL